MEIDEREQRMVVQILERLYGAGYIRMREVNPEVLEVLTKIVKATKACSKPLNLVPGTTVIVNVYDLRRLLVDLVRKIVTEPQQDMRCLVTHARNYRSRMDMAKQGI